MSTTDQVVPGQHWAFDADVADAFDDMLMRSIPQYEVMREATTELAASFAAPGTRILDLGCSRGAQLRAIIDRLGSDADQHYIGVDISAPMLEAARRELAEYVGAGVVEIVECDLRRFFPPGRYSVIVAVLALQFIPIEHRQRIVRYVYEALEDDGAFLMVEKCLGANHQVDEMFVSLYYQLKKRNGYTPDDIARKRLALEGVLVPITAAWNEQLLANAGFRSVDCYWRWMNFAAWIGVKDGPR